MIVCVCLALGLLLCVWQTPSAARFPDVSVDEYIDRYLEELGAVGYGMTPVTDDSVTVTFPNTECCGVYFRQWPVPVEPPEGMAQANVFFMHPNERQVYYLTSPRELLQMFRQECAIVGIEGGYLENAVKTWLLLSQQFSQDGYYQFSQPVVWTSLDFPTNHRSPSVPIVYGMVEVVQGGEGYIKVAMKVGPTGYLSVQEERNIVHVARPK
jgi:hypothetical protein